MVMIQLRVLKYSDLDKEMTILIPIYMNTPDYVH